MLDAQLKTQLQQLFSELSRPLELVLDGGPHDRRDELKAMLAELAEAHPDLHFRERLEASGGEAASLRFRLHRTGAPTGVLFRGIPGGHEFSSLVLALLNADGKGRLPDEGIQSRIRALKGPIRVRTYVSLSCTNCPDVVQALNLMALMHPDFEHETVDGALAEGEVKSLGIQGVPAVVLDGELLHAGKSSLGELLDKLEARFGHVAAVQEGIRSFDVLVVGGGPAGVSAAIYSARKGQTTALVAQRVGGQVRETLGIENLISVPKTEGLKLAADLAEHLSDYPITVLEHRHVESVELLEDEGQTWKVLRLQGGETLRARALIVASGAKWRELGIPGERDYIGRGVAFCPHCDGPFYKGRPVAVVGGGNSGVEAAIDLAGICTHVTLVEFAPELKADRILVEHLERLPNVEILVNAAAQEILGDGEGVVGLRLRDRAREAERTLPLEGVFVQIGLAPNSALVKDLVEVNRMGEIVVDGRCRTSLNGVYAAGDVTTVPFKQIIIAMGEGAKAALTAFEDRLRR